MATVDACPSPFISETLYPFTDGFYGGRNCAENPLTPGPNATRCCIPCPVFDWTYRNDFKILTDGAAWVHVAGFICRGFLLLSMLVLPSTATRRSYLNVVLLSAIMVLELGFIIPLARQPEQCYDPITPNNESSSFTCAFSAACVALGLMFFTTWVTVRAILMHLQICWNYTPLALTHTIATIVTGAISIGLTAATISHSGVSYRFGGYCHVNVGSLATFWGFILGFCGIALLLQLTTFGYVIRVYMSSAWQARNDPSSRSASVVSSSRARQARATARRVREVLVLQWGALAIVASAILTTVFVCVVFIFFDDRLTREAFSDVDKLIPWIICLVSRQNKSQCYQYTDVVIIPEDLAVATLFILAFVGIETFLLLFRFEIFTAWWGFLRTPWWKKKASSRKSSATLSGEMHAPGGLPRFTGETPADTPPKRIASEDSREISQTR
ncbi:hypothetical protein M409DRAFT_54782 [Zasmidium cellare ATCC 36951]|uniref:G-protein coupled receptors family 2 profile 2 domain-containing protein n=1 Tax=Zasmidium cellare ATCC 36951 TaxID=1080233 RepID=A0A6A6CHA3_ZASCE|nr:uncharacterized protein M409DRAFT_54782 [Zasmidium cellare ATCC 36951]KAF2166431.1 hypothetical protein M409DRAFT_54782 [Zasmidium cellare ATCC 36951]